MKYILRKRFALREWKDNRYPYGLLIFNGEAAFKLSREEFDLLKMADGRTDVPEEQESSETLKKLLQKGIIRPAKDGDILSEWQKHHYYDNPKYDSISLRLIGSCNFNCKHCFNAADVNVDTAQWKYEEVERLVNEASECGISIFRLTGGEPMLHPDFLKVMKLIKEKGMLPRDIITNGAFITQEKLDEIKAINDQAQFLISFDCLGHHDWMRGKKGIEQKTIDAIKLCVENGFYVLLDVQVNKVTMDSLVETAEFFDKLGVNTFRFIRTTETPRWRELAGDAALSIEEYYDVCVDFLKKYYAKEHKMDIIGWQFGWFYSKEKRYNFSASRCNASDYNDDIFSCRLNSETISLGSNGNIYPCHQISGQYDYLGWKLPNVKEVGLRAAMNDKEFLHDSRVTWGEIAKANEKCRNCLHFKQCGGGCRACAIVLSNNDFMGSDLYMCKFYEGNYPEKVASVLKDWTVQHKPIETHYGQEDLFETACEILS